MFGDHDRFLLVWPSFCESPILTHLRWPLLVHTAFTHNAHLYTHTPYPAWSYSSSSFPLLPESVNASIPAKDVYTMIPGLLVLHVRRGDFDTHCQMLADWRAYYNAMNRLPEFQDTFEPLHGHKSGKGNAPRAAKKHYMKHCYPSIRQIVARIEEVVNTLEGKDLKYIYVMTNGKKG